MSVDEKTWKAFSRWYRLSRSNHYGWLRCCTCSRSDHWTEMDTGHWKKREWKLIKYCLFNLGPQCRICNRMKDGEPIKMEAYLRNKYGTVAIEFVVETAHSSGALDDKQLDELRLWCNSEFKRIKESKA